MARLHMLAIGGLAGCHFSAAPTHGDGAPGSEGSPTGTGYHKVISIAGAGTSMLADFPLWIDLVDADLAAHATNDGSDIYFVLPDGTKLDFELERWDPQGGGLGAWVRIPTLDASTKLELHYGDPASASPPSPAGVFAGYAGVWHMSDTLTGTTVVDATGQRNGNAQGLGASAQVAGKLAGAIAFDGTSQIDFMNPLAGPSPHTISAWLLQSAPGQGAFDSVMTLGNTSQSQARFLDSRYTATGVAVGFFNNDWTSANLTVTGAGWTLIHWVFGGANRRSQLYRNGILAGEFTHQSEVATAGAGGIIGNAPSGFGPNVGFPGTLDEVRISPVPLSPAWIAAEFANQSDPPHFYSVGPEQSP